MIRILIFIFVICVGKSQWVSCANNMTGNVRSIPVGSYNGDVYLIGSLNTKFRFNDATETFESLGNTGVSIQFYGQGYAFAGRYLYNFYYQGNYIDRYDMSNLNSEVQDAWKYLQTPIEERVCLAATSTHLYVSGGVDDKYNTAKTLQILDLVTTQWLSNVPDMNEPRKVHACAIDPETLRLYAFGGGNIGWAHTRSIEYINVNTLDQWQLIDQQNYLTVAVGYGRAIYSSFTKRIYIVGGYDYVNSANVYRDTVHVFDPSTNAITLSAAKLPIGLAETSVISMNNIIFVFGGTTDLVSNGNVNTCWKLLLTEAPTEYPTHNPTIEPTILPTNIPTIEPTVMPTSNTFSPTLTPTEYPTFNPTAAPTNSIYCVFYVETDVSLQTIESVSYQNKIIASIKNVTNEYLPDYAMNFENVLTCHSDNNYGWQYTMDIGGDESMQQTKTLFETKDTRINNLITDTLMSNNIKLDSIQFDNEILIECDISNQFISTQSPTKVLTSMVTSDNDAISQEMNVSDLEIFNDTAYALVILIILLPLCISLCAFRYHSKKKGSDWPFYFSIFKYFSAIGDFYTDAILSLTLYTFKNDLWVWSILFTFGSHILSIIIGLIFITKWRQSHLNKATMIRSEYVKKYDTGIIFLTLTSGFYAAIDLITSHLFHIPFLCLWIGNDLKSQLRIIKIFNNVLIENVPCLYIQYSFALQLSNSSSIFNNGLNITLLAMTFSLLSITFSVLTLIERLSNTCIDRFKYGMNKQIFNNKIKIEMQLKQTSKNDSIQDHHIYTHYLICDAMHLSFGVPATQIMVEYIDEILDGIQFGIEIRSLSDNDMLIISEGLKHQNTELCRILRKEICKKLKLTPENIDLIICNAGGNTIQSSMIAMKSISVSGAADTDNLVKSETEMTTVETTSKIASDSENIEEIRMTDTDVALPTGWESKK